MAEEIAVWSRRYSTVATLDDLYRLIFVLASYACHNRTGGVGRRSCLVPRAWSKSGAHRAWEDAMARSKPIRSTRSSNRGVSEKSWEDARPHCGGNGSRHPA